MGFTVPHAVADGAVRSYRTLSPLPTCRSSSAVYSLLHFPSHRCASPLTSMLSVGVRTFLPPEIPAGDRLDLSGTVGDSILRIRFLA